MTQPATDLSRRQALKVGAGVVALAIGGGIAWSQLGAGDSPDAVPSPDSVPPMSDIQIDALGGLDKSAIAALDPAIALIGRRYLTDHPNESDPALLLSLLPDPADNPIAAASAALAEEFGKGDTVSVAGWVLATSEARAAAVVALVCSASGQC